MVYPIVDDTSSRVSRSTDGLVASFHHLCKRGAHKFWRSGLEKSDLEQVAAIGLIKAARRYDPTMPTPFEAYAWLMIVGELMHHVRDSERAIRIPRRLLGLERAFSRAHEALLVTLGREPSDTELAEALGVLEPVIAELHHVRNLAAPLRIDECGADRIALGTPLDLADRILIDDAFAALSQNERFTVVGIYLLGLTQLEIGRRLDLSAKRVSRLHRAALRRMRGACAS